jgi:hypothetical protein
MLKNIVENLNGVSDVIRALRELNSDIGIGPYHAYAMLDNFSRKYFGQGLKRLTGCGIETVGIFYSGIVADYRLPE